MWDGAIKQFFTILRHVAIWGVMALQFIAADIAFAAAVEITASLNQSGGIVGPLNVVGDDFCPTGNAPGCDISATDNRVRTHDAVSYNISMKVDPPGDNVFVNISFKPGLKVTDLPGACDAFTSTITGDGTASSPSKVHCDLKFRSSWATTLTFIAIVDGKIANGTVTGLESAEIGGTNTPTVQANLSSLKGQVVSATPRLNLTKVYHIFYSKTRNGVDGVDMTFRYFVGLWENDRNGNTGDDPDPILGHENVTDAISFTEDMTAISPNTYLVSCKASNSAAFPYQTYDPVYPQRSVIQAGTPSCANTGSAATGAQTVTISGADLSLEHFPTETRNGNAFPATRKYASFGMITVFVPLSDIKAAGGSLVTTNTFKDLKANSISGQLNYNGVGEDVSDNVVSQTLQNNRGSFSQSYRCFLPGTASPDWCNSYWASAPTNASVVSAGNGVVEPRQTFVSYTYYRNRSFIGDNEAEVCAVLDSRYVELIAQTNGSPHYCAGQCGTLGTDYVVEYGNNYAATAWRDAVVTPSHAVRDECNATSANWNSSFAAAKSAGPITKVRMRRLTPLLASGTHAMALQLAPLDMAELTGVPNGTLIKTWGTFKSTTSSDDFRNCSYKAGVYPAPSHSTNSCGDRLALTRALARIDKTTQPANTTNVIEAGGEIAFELAPTFTSIGGTLKEAVQIVDELPLGAEYVAGSATQNGSPFPPVITGNLGTGQTLTWNLGTLKVNDPIAPINFTMSVPSYTAGGTKLTNIARIETIADTSDDAARSDSRAVTVTAPKSMLMNKQANVPAIEKDGSMIFTVTYDNSTNATFNEIDVIDIFPFNGDGRFPPSSYSGTTKLGTINATSTNVQFYVTKDTPSGVSNNPQNAQNDFTTGSVRWCPMTTAHKLNPAASPTIGGTTSQCPQNAAAVTGLRLIDTAPLSAGQDRSFTFSFLTSGNIGDDIYNNQARGTADTITLSPLSPFAVVTVTGKGQLDAVKTVSMWDPSNEGLYAVPGNEVVYTFTVTNTGDGPVDSDSMILMDALPAEIEFWNGDIDADGNDSFPGTDRIGFKQTVGTGVTFNAATDLRFKTGTTPPTDFSQCSAVAADSAFRSDLTHICFNPKGVLSHGNPDPTFSLSLRARIK